MATKKKTTKKTTTTIVKKVVVNKPKVETKYPFEKEHKKDPSICKSCGQKIGQSFLIGGVCKNCHFKLGRITEDYRRGFVVNELEIRGM